MEHEAKQTDAQPLWWRSLSAGTASPLVTEFAALAMRLSRGDEWVGLAAAMTMEAVATGHSCVVVAELHRQPRRHGITLPPADAWLAHLRQPAFRSLIRPPEDAEGGLLVLTPSGRIFLQRYWDYEQRLCRALLARCIPQPFPTADLASELERLFPQPEPLPTGWFNWQRVAAFAVLRQRLAVISGGPGAGKTSVVVRIVALLTEVALAAGEPLPRVRLAAPTGKAAARLTEAIRTGIGAVDTSPEVRKAIRLEAATVHRLLGVNPTTGSCRHHAGNPLAADLVVIDEASMIALPLMTRLVEAVPDSARLVLLGDMDQLASVEPGFVLGDICAAAGTETFSPSFRTAWQERMSVPLPTGETATAPLADAVVRLAWSWRFPPGSVIDRISRAIRAGDGEEALADAGIERPQPGDAGILAPASSDSTQVSVLWRSPDSTARTALLRQWAGSRFAAQLQADAPAEALDACGKFRILCVHNEGPAGVDHVNSLIERALRLRPGGEPFYHGRPIMISENAPHLRLFNGDMGIIRQEGETLSAWFQDSDGVRAVAPHMLPTHRTAFAMTVHKSQGSQFDDVLLVLPDKASPVLTRELIYTAVTRAARRVEIWAAREIFIQAAACGTTRYSGLQEALAVYPTESKVQGQSKVQSPKSTSPES